MFNISKFKDIERREYECEVVTPLFLGGANQNAELRAASIKGVFRFWWRALYGCNELESMRQTEDTIWGSTQCKSSVTIKVVSQDELRPIREKLDRGNFNIYEYLAYGYRNGNDIKSYFREGCFKICLSYKKEFREQVANTLSFLMHYGGIGAKSRNGFGSLHCQVISTPIFNNFNKGPLKPFTSLSEHALLFGNFPEHSTWKEALSDIGNAYKNGRLELKNRKINRAVLAKPFLRDNSRHAKPYFLHVNKTQTGKYQGQIVFLPYKYHDEKKRTEYDQACSVMNKSIEAAMGGSK